MLEGKREGRKGGGREINIQHLLVVRPLAYVTLPGWNERAAQAAQMYIMSSLHMERHA